MKNIKKRKVLFALLLLVALSACSNYAESSGDDFSKSEPEINESTHDDQYGKTINISKSSYACSKEGVYELRSLHPNSVNIVYTDFEKAQTLVLCAQPNCTHDSSSCVSYIPIENGDLEPTIMCNNESLIIVKEGAGQTESPYIAVAELNGSNRHTIATYKSNQFLRGDFMADSRFLYFILQEVDENEYVSTSLEAVDLQHEKQDELLQLPDSDKMYALMGAYEDSLFLLEMNTNDPNGDRKIYEINPENPNLSNILFQYNAENEYVLIENPFMYIMREKDNVVLRIELSSLDEQEKLSIEKQEKTSYSFDNSAYKALLEPCSDGNIFIYEYYPEGTFRKIYIDITTGKAHEITLISEYSEEPMPILATYKNYFLVLYNRNELTLETSDSSSYGVTFENQYALIPINDYICGEPTFEFVSDDV